MSSHIFEACLRGESPEISHLPVLIAAFNALPAMELFSMSIEYKIHPVVAKIINRIIGEKISQANLNNSLNRISALYQTSCRITTH